MKFLVWFVVFILAIEALIFGNQSALMFGLVFAVIGIVMERKWQ